MYVIFLLVCRNSRCVRSNMIGTAATGFYFETVFNSFQRRNCYPCFGIYSSCYSREFKIFSILRIGRVSRCNFYLNLQSLSGGHWTSRTVHR